MRKLAMIGDSIRWSLDLNFVVVLKAVVFI